MFSASKASGGPVTRSRRRQRPASQEHVAQLPKAKRQRLPLTEQTFSNPPQPQQPQVEPGVADVEMKMEKARAPEPKSEENRHSTPHKDISVRTKKPKHSDRVANKSDGSLVLVRESISKC